MRNRGFRAYYRGGAGRGTGRGSPVSVDSSDNPHSGDGAQAGGNAEHSQSVSRGGRGGGVHSPRGGPTGGRGRESHGAPELRGRQVDIDVQMADARDVATAHTAQGPASDIPPLRPDFGMSGTRISLYSNFFPVRMPRGPLYEYVVDMVPSAPRPVERRVFYLAEQTTAWRQGGMHANVAHDTKTRLVSVIQLPQPLKIAVPYYDEGQAGPPEQGGSVYTLSINFIRQINTENLASYLAGESDLRNYNTLPGITALGTILTSISSKVDTMDGRRRRFSITTADLIELGGGLEAWRGFRPVLKPVYEQLMVRVGISTSVFRIHGNLARAIREIEHSQFGTRVEAFIRGLKIRTTHLGHHKTIRRIAPHTARSYAIDTPEYGHVTMEDYFRQKYNMRLRYCDMPLIDVGPRTPDYLPAEVCDILPGQHFYGRLTSEHSAAMTATGHRFPHENMMSIVNHVRNQLALDVTRPELRSFGMTIGQDMALVPGRILPKPGIKYLSGVALINKRAAWNLKEVKFATGARLENWAVLLIKDGSLDEFTGSEDQHLRWVVERFRNMCNASGMHVIDDPRYVTAQLAYSDPSDSLRQPAIEKIRDVLLTVNPKPTIFLVVLANGNQTIYAGLKHLCDVFLDVATVCIQSCKCRKNNPHYLANVALKMNMKLGGVNHRLDSGSEMWLNSASTMVVGIHVSRPRRGSVRGTPSVAAVVASIDNDFAQYPASLRIQAPRVEVVRHLESMMIERLKLFQAENKGRLPERIIIYRNGVSEGQFNQVKSVELPQILGACSTFCSDAPYRPKITIIVCGKRTQVRFYPTDVSSTGSVGNPPPGTVVDSGITAIYNFDFFLQSHDASSGTARPVHYSVVYDEIDFKADELQGITNSLCYMFARATKSVRLVSPASYAQLASQRGRCYLRALYEGWSSAGDVHEDVMQEAQRLWGSGVSGAGLKNTMFYL